MRPQRIETSITPQRVPRTGLEPARLAAHAPETCASTNSATWAKLSDLMRAENETRTRDPNLGKVMLYQLSYFRVVWAGTDSNCRSRKATDLQSARFNHLPTYPIH